MNAVVDRLRAVREAWGLSARAMSMELGLSHTLWGFYEAGRSQPGIQTLTELARRKVDLNWLLTGEYTAGVSSGNESEGDLASVLGSLEQKRLRTLGITRLSFAARRGLSASKIRVLEFLIQNPMTSRQEIEAGTGLDNEKLIEVLVDLIENNHIEVASNHDTHDREVYRVTRTLQILQAEAESDVAQIALNAVQLVAVDVVGGLRTSPNHAGLVSGTVNLAEMGAFMRDITNRLAYYGAQEGNVRCKFVFAATEVKMP